MVLFIFVIMLLNAGTEHKGRRTWATCAGVPLLLLFLGMIAHLIARRLPASENVMFGQFTKGSPLEFGRALFTIYLLPFEVTSVLILIAILGAVVLAKKEID
jgi:NADH-quinone oxidoreductase subunit J